MPQREEVSTALPVSVLKKRADFLACNKGRRQPMPGFVLLVRDRNDGESGIRLGITVTKKIGGAVVRNRMKRRFRALARQILPLSGVPGADHVLIGRSDGVERDYARLSKELEKALTRIKSSSGTPPHSPRAGDGRKDGNRHFGRGKGGRGKGNRNKEGEGKTPSASTVPGSDNEDEGQ